ncbi:MAG: RNA polymerase subunit sigma [Bacteroidetes bacterium RIFCSPLOWO2_12_FULL_37_12]|nr:MAG: RNA polymerase subunit sigma [Bacteroidetes bacterium RIFCSPLOWO2_12_FULL_37_12]
MRQLKISKQITTRESFVLEKYLNEIGKVELITAEAEVSLSRRIKEGDHAAMEKLVNSNLRFVVSVAKQYQNQGLTLGDLINEGNLGLIKAASRFDETRGFKFISYAVWWIRQSILQAIAENARIIRLPLNRLGSLNKISQTLSKLEQQFEREPSAEELSEVLNIPLEELMEIMQYKNKHISVDTPLTEGEETKLVDILEGDENVNPDKKIIHDSLKKEIERTLTSLSEREAEVLKLYYGLCSQPVHSLEEIGEKFDLTKERARQLKERALRRIRHMNCSRLLKAYLG